MRVLTQNLWGWYHPLDSPGIGRARPGYHVAHQTRREADGSGVSIASRWPLAEVQAPPPFGPLLFVNHKPNFELALEHERGLRAVATATLLERLAADREVHVVVAGDFGAPPDADSLRFWRGRQTLGGTSVCYRDAWEQVNGGDPGHTFTPDNPTVAEGTWPLERGRRIDYVLVRCRDHGPSLDITACARILDQPVSGVWGSDHFGVVADLAPPPPEPMVPDQRVRPRARRPRGRGRRRTAGGPPSGGCAR